MKAWQQILLALLCGALIVVGAWTFGYARGEQDASYRAKTDTIRVTIARLDTVYRADTVRLWRIKRAVDTLVRVDSIPVLAADSARADSSLRVLYAGLQACAPTVLTCEQRLDAERRLRVLAESTLAGRSTVRPSRRGRTFVAGALAGAGAVLLLRR